MNEMADANKDLPYILAYKPSCI